MSYDLCVFMDSLKKEDNIEYVDVDCFANIDENIKQCMSVSVIERMSGKRVNKVLVIHPCVTLEKGFWVYLERLLKRTKIHIKVLTTENVPSIFQSKCKFVFDKKQDDNKECIHLSTRWRINRYRDKLANDSYIMAFVKKYNM
jgi:hypothetical protein